MTADGWWIEKERDLDVGLAECRYDEQGDDRERRLDLAENRRCLLRPVTPIPDQWGEWPTMADLAAARARGQKRGPA